MLNVSNYFVFFSALLFSRCGVTADDTGLGNCYLESTKCDESQVNSRAITKSHCLQHASGWCGSWKKWGDDICYDFGASGTGYQFDDCRDEGLILPNITQTVAYKNYFGAWMQEGTTECIKRDDPESALGPCFLHPPDKPDCDVLYAGEMTKKQCYWSDTVQQWRPGVYDFENPTKGNELCETEAVA